MKNKYKYINFVPNSSIFDGDGYYEIRNNKSNALLGTIDFYDNWNQYVLNTIDGIVFNKSCLLDIINFISQLKHE